MLKHFEDDSKVEEIEKFKNENSKVIGLLDKLAARKEELVDKTLFDDFENNLALQLIDNRLNKISAIIQNNPETTWEYVTQAIKTIKNSLADLHNKVNILLPKSKIDRDILPLRDPLDLSLFPLFFTNAGS